MNYIFPQDVHRIVESHLSSGRYASEDDVLRDALRALQEEDEDLVAVKEAIAEWRAGDDGIPLDEAFNQVRRSRTAEQSP